MMNLGLIPIPELHARCVPDHLHSKTHAVFGDDWVMRMTSISFRASAEKIREAIPTV